jgi:glycolate oxidase
LYSVEDLAVYSYDAFAEGSQSDRPAETTEQVSNVVRLAAEAEFHHPRRMGSGCSRLDSIPGEIVICLTRMNHILRLTPNATASVEAGVVTADLQKMVLGLFYPPDPSSIRHSTIGGNIAWRRWSTRLRWGHR